MGAARRPPARLVALALAASALLACGRNATIVRDDGPEVRGRIVSSDEEAIVVEGEETRIRVRRAQVERIHHPGTAAMATGGFLLLGSGATIVGAAGELGAAEADCEDSQEHGTNIGPAPGCLRASGYRLLIGFGIVGGLVGGGLVVHGIMVGRESREAAEAPRREVAPAFWIEPGGAGGGIAARF